MAPEQRKQVLLAILAILMAVAAYRLWPASTTGDAPVASNVRGAAKTQGAQSGITAPDVHIESLNEERPKPQELERNVFRFRAKAAPPPADGGKPAPPPPPVPTGPPPTPGLPPIALKLINIWEYTEQKKKVAVLTDGKGGVPIYGSEGDTVEGRYKILKIGTESVEMAYLDGRGRMTIRLAGQ
jgi:hypothetical protein